MSAIELSALVIGSLRATGNKHPTYYEYPDIDTDIGAGTYTYT